MKAEYRAWKAMKSRCYSSCNKDHGKYQKNKINVCAEWLNDFDKFYADMGDKPSHLHSLERIDNLKDYSKSNCKWATKKEQAINRSEFNKVFTHNGESRVLKEWAKKLNIRYTTLYQRIYRSGLSFEDAIKKDPFDRLVNINGLKKTVKEWCLIYDRKYTTVINRIHSGWKKKDAILTETP